MNFLNILLRQEEASPLPSLSNVGRKFHATKRFKKDKSTSPDVETMLLSTHLMTLQRASIEQADLFSCRGSCLQSLEWHLDAIDDFTKAISLEPENCNFYFQRAMSKIACGDQQGFLVDIKEAIRLSR